MWDTCQDIAPRHELSHDRPCQRCGHAAHRYLACDSACDCRPVDVPGLVPA